MHMVRAEPEDAAALTHIAFAAKQHWGYPEKWMQQWRESLTIRPEFISSSETYSAIIDGEPVGFYGLCSNGGQLRLEHLWVLPEAMGGGVGCALFAHALERARAEKRPPVKAFGGLSGNTRRNAKLLSSTRLLLISKAPLQAAPGFGSAGAD